MTLSNELIKQFAKITTSDEKKKSETISYGTVVKNNGQKCVRLDGSDVLTPMTTASSANEGDRVAVLIKNHEVVVLGNMSSPSVSIGMLTGNNVTDTDKKHAVQDVNHLMGLVARYGESILGLEEAKALRYQLEELKNEVNTKSLTTEDITAINAQIESLRSKMGKFDVVESTSGYFDKISAYVGKFTYINAINIEGKYANIDFSNIKSSTMESFYAKSGLIKDVTIGDGTITGELNGVTINGNLIKGSTIVADKLILKGTDGLYYKLNTDGIKTEAEQTEYNSLKGDIFMAKSIAATKINVSDLVAFGATIGGFKLTSDSIYSGGKQTVENTTRGIYLDNDGQVSFGNASKHIKFFKDTDDEYKLLISGAVIENENFKILDDGSMEAVNGSFKGTINAKLYSFLESGSLIRGRSTGGFDFYFSEGGMRIVFDEGGIWRVDTSGTWTKLAG